MVPLKVNREVLLLERLRARKPEAFGRYLELVGGIPLARSYGAEPELVSFRVRLPAAHLRFLEELRPYHEEDHQIYVHAGMPAGKHPRECAEGDLFWIDDQVYSFTKPGIYGHQVQAGRGPLDLPDRIGLDTDCGLGAP